MTATEGETIGHYRVGRRLGGGGMGVVHEAVDETLGRSVALKLIAPELAADAEFRARFTREAQAQASLDSPHVVHVYGHGEFDGQLWLASQLIPDGDLRGMLDRYGAPPLATALDVAQQVASGLADAHGAGLVHRDIKPANVLLRRRGSGFQVYLSDFGIARRVDADPTRTGTASAGTPTYMAPELHTGGAPGVASDLYSLGCLLWTCLTGRAPYAGASEFELVTAHRERPVPQLPEDSEAVVATNRLLRRLMAKEPRDRPAAAAAVRDELARLRAVTGSPQPPVVPPALATVNRRLPRVLIAVAVLAVLAAAVAIGIGLSRDDAPDTATGPPPTQTGTPSGTPSPSEVPSEDPVADGDVDAAVSSMADALTTTGMTADQAECVARQTIEDQGLVHLVEIGLFDDDLAFRTDLDLAPYPEVKAALSSATLACLTS